MRYLTFAALFLLTPGLTWAACPSIEGSWAITYDEVYIGDTWSGVGVATISGDQIVYKGTESYQGLFESGTIWGRFTIDESSCRIVWTYKNPGLGIRGVVHGVIVNANKMFLIFSNADVQSSGRAEAERMQ